MQMRYWELIDKEVLDIAGLRIGHIADLVAERQGDDLCVTALRIGPRALVRRIAFRRVPLPEHTSHQIPWRYVTHIDQRVHLAITHTELRAIFTKLAEERRT